MYAPESPFTVYCKSCYYSDAWDPKAYGRSYDHSRSFFDQCAELFTSVPKPATMTAGVNVNSEYQNLAGSNKDVYMVFNSRQNDMLMYSRGMWSCRDTSDCYFGVNVELSYESINIHNSSRVRWGQNVQNCVDSWFLRDCTGCSNCFGCVNLRYKSYHFFNEPLSKEEYERRVGAIMGSGQGLAEMKKKFEELSISHPFRADHNMKSEDCSGDYIIESKNCHQSFEITKNEQCSYNYFTKATKDSYDCMGYGTDSELLYECVAAGTSHKIFGCVYAESSTELEYCHSMRGSSSCIACDGMDKAQFAILNTPYPEHEYRAVREHIVESLKNDGLWGQFFPLSLAPFAFNESCAMDYCPLSKDEAMLHGYNWKHNLPGTTGMETMSLARVPNHIDDCLESIIKEVLACEVCSRNYKITTQELGLYRQMSVPIPLRCFNCRHTERLRRRGPLELRERHCSQCASTLHTALREDSAPIVYCDTCYSAAVV